MKKIFLLLIAATFSLSLHAADGFSSVEEQMSGKEFVAAGLDKLSPEELAALNSWIRSRSLATLDTPAAAAATAGVAGSTDERGFEVKNQKMERVPIETRIVGAFTGWDGNTIFELENGMIWEQADKDKFYVREVQNPDVILEPGAFRTWRLKLVGYGSECRVERIQ